MSIDLTAFTPIASTIGGVLIGLGAALLLLGTGRVAGISGIAGGLINGNAADRQWRLAFLIGLVAPALLYALFTRAGLFGTSTAPITPIVVETGLGQLIVSGVLVGIGTGLASGCTSGHGICGIARLSPRSLLATALFMASAILVVFIARHVLRS